MTHEERLKELAQWKGFQPEYLAACLAGAEALAWIAGECLCPCCLEVLTCAPGCTFAVDCPDAAERMADLRALLATEETR